MGLPNRGISHISIQALLYLVLTRLIYYLPCSYVCVHGVGTLVVPALLDGLSHPLGVFSSVVFVEI